MQRKSSEGYLWVTTVLCRTNFICCGEEMLFQVALHRIVNICQGNVIYLIEASCSHHVRSRVAHKVSSWSKTCGMRNMTQEFISVQGSIHLRLGVEFPSIPRGISVQEDKFTD